MTRSNMFKNLLFTTLLTAGLYAQATIIEYNNAMADAEVRINPDNIFVPSFAYHDSERLALIISRLRKSDKSDVLERDLRMCLLTNEAIQLISKSENGSLTQDESKQLAAVKKYLQGKHRVDPTPLVIPNSNYIRNTNQSQICNDIRTWKITEDSLQKLENLQSRASDINQSQSALALINTNTYSSVLDSNRATQSEPTSTEKSLGSN